MALELSLPTSSSNDCDGGSTEVAKKTTGGIVFVLAEKEPVLLRLWHTCRNTSPILLGAGSLEQKRHIGGPPFNRLMSRFANIWGIYNVFVSNYFFPVLESHAFVNLDGAEENFLSTNIRQSGSDPIREIFRVSLPGLYAGANPRKEPERGYRKPTGRFRRWVE